MATKGIVKGIVSNLVTVEVGGPVSQNEICYISVGGVKLMSEVIKVIGKNAFVQVFESTRGMLSLIHIYTSKQETAVIEGNLFGKSIPAPWCDTEICVKGDYFARHFGKEVTLCIDEYQAAAVDAHIDTLLIEQEAPNMNTTKSGYCAPATVQFSAIANTPTAALFNWKIYRQGEEDNPVVRFTGEEVDYTFNQSGTFIIKLEVSDQSTTCSTEDEVQIDISESYLMIPNAFSPGTTPGINDEFRVAYKSLVKFKAWIFNRWGLQMYYWTDPAQGWDGKKGGKYVQPGVYFYVIEAEGSDGIKYKEKGDINILRPKTIQDENENIQE